MTRALDALMSALAILIGVLLLTGGAHFTGPEFKVEISQVDAFALALFALALTRHRLAGGYFPEAILACSRRGLEILERKPGAVLAGAIAAYVILQTGVSAWRFASFHANAYDLSYLDQPIWSTFRVGFLHSSLAVNQTYLGEHFAPAIALFAPVYRVWDSVYALFFVQSLILGGSAWLLYRLALALGVRAPAPILLSLCFLLYQPLRAANTFDFREDNLFVPVFLGALLALATARTTVFWLLCAFSWFVKENAALFTALLGAWACLAPRSLRPAGTAGVRPRRLRFHGAVLFVSSLAVFCLVNQELTPIFSGGSGKTRFAFRMGAMAQSGTGLFAFALEHPFDFFAYLAKQFLNASTLKYFLIVFTPFLFFARSAPIPFLIALAGFAMNVVLGIHSVGFHYECVIIPFLFYSLALALSRQRSRALGSAPAACILLSFLFFYGRSPVHDLRAFVPGAHHRMVSEELQKIPREASVATQSALHPHLTHRKDAFLLAGPPTADYVAVDLSEGIDRYGTPNLLQDVAAMDSASYDKVVDRDGLIIWKKR